MGTQEDLPVKAPKKERKKYEKTVFLLTCKEKTAVQKREDKGLLAGLWEFPNVPGRLSPDEAVRQAEGWSTEPEAPLRSLERVHIFTHAEWDMTCYIIPCRKMPDTFHWVNPSEMNTEIALPTAFRIFWEAYNG